MKKKLVLASATLLCSGAAFAIDATINFTGTIILPTCSVNPQSVSQTIDLGTAKTTDFAQIGSTQNPKAFQIDLEGCATGTNVAMTVNGTTDPSANSVLKNTGTAAAVGVQMLLSANTGDTTGTPITIGTSQAMGVIDATGKKTIPMVAQFYRLGTMTAGPVTSQATVNFTYN
jgi:major type 1 subunit fimbrin (pilin)